MPSSLFPTERSAAVQSAIRALSESGDEPRGAIYTRKETVDVILDLSGYVSDVNLTRYRLLEPAFGRGDFILPAIERLLASFAAFGRDGEGPVDSLSNCIRGVELHRASYDATKRKVMEVLTRFGISSDEAGVLATAWLRHDDFLLSDMDIAFTHVVGNPPYVRQELIPGPLLQVYRQQYKTIYDRADLYIPFIERGLTLLEPHGVLAYICSDRWMKNRYGGPLRRMISKSYHLRYYIDMNETQAFQSDVTAYPGIFVIAREKGTDTRVAHRTTSGMSALGSLVADLTRRSDMPQKQVSVVSHVVNNEHPWLLKEDLTMAILRRLESEFPSIEQTGCSVGIGVATGADGVFIGNDNTLPVESSRKIPLISPKDVVNDTPVWKGTYVLNPFESDGTIVDLRSYPMFADYVLSHYDILAHRHVAKRGSWYRTIDRIHASLTHTPKLLIPDISGQTRVYLEPGLWYPHHNFYYVTSQIWDLRALRAILRSFVAEFFVGMYSVRMRGGYLRFQAQYIRRIHIPRWEDLGANLRKRLIEASERDLVACDHAAVEAFRLTEAEVQAVHMADETLRRRRHGH